MADPVWNLRIERSTRRFEKNRSPAQSAPDLHIPSAQDRPAAKSTSHRRAASAPIRLGAPELISRPRNVLIPPGSMVSAVLITSASDGPVKAELKEPLAVGGEALLEARTILVGSGQSAEDRLRIHFQKASHVGGRAVKLAAGIGLNFAGGLSQGLEQT